MIPEMVRLKRLKNYLVSLEVNLDIISDELLSIRKNVDYLLKLEQDLIANIQILKKEKIVSIASEYQKTKEELSTTRKNLEYYRNRQQRLESDKVSNRAIYKDYLHEYKELEHFLDNRKVILLFDSSKRKKKDSDEG